MDVRSYGKSGLDVSAIAYGAMTLAADPQIRDGVAPSLLRALERGVTLIDTARVYPKSEELIASTLRAWRGPRPIISTKLHSASRDAYRFHCPIAEAYPPQRIRESVEGSLRALGVEQLDIVHLHQWHYLWTHERSWLDTLHALREEGKIRCIAISAQDHEHDAVLEIVSSRPGRWRAGDLQCLRVAADVGVAAAGERARRRRDRAVCLRQRRLVGHAHARRVSRTSFPAARAVRAVSGAARRARAPLRSGEKRAALPELALRFALSVPGVSAATLGMPETRLVDAAIDAAERGPLSPATVEAIRREHVWTRNFYERLS